MPHPPQKVAPLTPSGTEQPFARTTVRHAHAHCPEPHALTQRHCPPQHRPQPCPLALCPVPHQHSLCPLSPPGCPGCPTQPLDHRPYQCAHVVVQCAHVVSALALCPMTTLVTTRPVPMPLVPHASTHAPMSCTSPRVTCHTMRPRCVPHPYAPCPCAVRLALYLVCIVPRALPPCPRPMPHAPRPYAMRPCGAPRVASCVTPLCPSPQEATRRRHHRHATRVPYG